MDQQATRQGPRPRSYTEDYKRQVVDVVVSTGRTATSVAAEVGLHHTLLSRWVRRYGPSAGAAAAAPARPAPVPSLKPVPVPHAAQAAEIARLKRENERLRMERDILKRGSPSLRSCHDEVWVHQGPPRPLAGAGDVRRAAGLPLRLLRLACPAGEQACGREQDAAGRDPHGARGEWGPLRQSARARGAQGRREKGRPAPG